MLFAFRKSLKLGVVDMTVLNVHAKLSSFPEITAQFYSKHVHACY